MEAIEQLNKAVKLAETSAIGLLKSHVKEYTRQNGTVVAEHEDSRQAQGAKHKLHEYYDGDHKALQEDIHDHGSPEKLAFALGWQHENYKFKGYDTDKEPTDKQLGDLKRHYKAGKKHAQERTRQGHDADAGMHDAFDRHMGRQ